jgi:hypothetical protein
MKIQLCISVPSNGRNCKQKKGLTKIVGGAVTPKAISFGLVAGDKMKGWADVELGRIYMSISLGVHLHARARSCIRDRASSAGYGVVPSS